MSACVCAFFFFIIKIFFVVHVFCSNVYRALKRAKELIHGSNMASFGLIHPFLQVNFLVAETLIIFYFPRFVLRLL